MKERPWIITHDSTAGDKAYAMECLRCGDIQRVALPITIDGWVAMAKVFTRHHEQCKVRDGE